ncbi:MAG: hypothetical protein DHS20C11_01110 [Lysobacteraceae bacterium]|nr:MAG: hypothetical protein DHS20C11_01110 [Xanthomonadaceae bacterium]
MCASGQALRGRQSSPHSIVMPPHQAVSMLSEEGLDCELLCRPESYSNGSELPLGFYVDADCVKCVECRKAEQQVKLLMLEYEALLKLDKRDGQESARLKEVAEELFRVGYIKNPDKARGK